MLDDAKLYEAEELACSPPDSREKQYLAQAIFWIRSLQHQLDDPNYQYSGRISRQALICRDRTIESYRQVVKDMEAHIDKLKKEIEDLKYIAEHDAKREITS